MEHKNWFGHVVRWVAVVVSVAVIGLAALEGAARAQTPGDAISRGARKIDGAQWEEKVVRWIWMHRASILDSCLIDAQACGFKDSFARSWTEMEKLLSQGGAEPPEFVSERERPDLFQTSSNDTHRVAVTGERAGSKIYFNRDRIKGLKIGILTAILFHELAHHIGFEDDEHRWPDQIGARVARHLEAQLSVSQLDELSRPDVQIGIFQRALKPTFFQEDLKKGFFNFAFLTDGQNFVDIDLSAFDLSPACDEKDDVLYVQATHPARWTVARENGQGYSVRAISVVQNLCGARVIARPDMKIKISQRVFRVSFDLNAQADVDWSSVKFYLTEPTMDDLIDSRKTLKLVESRVLDSRGAAVTRVQPGESIFFTALLKPLKEITTLAKCTVTFTNSEWPEQKEGIPVLETLEDCRMEWVVHGSERLVKMTARLSVPRGLKPGVYQFYFLQIMAEKDFSLLQMPKTAQFEVMDAGAYKETRIRGVTFPGVSALASVGAQELKNSATYQRDQEFEIIVDVESESLPKREAFGLGLVVRSGSDELSVADFSGEVDDLSFVILGRKAEKTTSGFLLRYRVKIPAHMQNYEVFGLWIKRVFFSDQERNWHEIAFPSYDHLILWDEFAKAN